MSGTDPIGVTRSWNRTQLNRRRGTVRLSGSLSTPGDSPLGLQRLSFDRGQIDIGRESDNRFVIPDSSVSRHHARIRRVVNDFVIEDLGSSNGTYVDGVPIIYCTLRSGDEIQIGGSLLFFEQLVEFVGIDESQMKEITPSSE